ncbi:MAG: sugar phosphate isomerase/epimerase [Clostridia bacterium]|nr:sugar phosphate isomerase/epimerase [Clostridia bacterium]
MRTAFSTLSCMDNTPEQISRLAKKYGFDAVEIRLDENGAFNGLSDPRSVRELFPCIEILSLNTGIILTPETDVTRDIKKSASFAASCGARGIRVFAGLRGNLAHLSDSVVASSKAAEGEGSKLLIETHGALTSTTDMRRLLDLTGRPFGVIWDVLHTLESGETVIESADNLKGAISHVHLKDAVRTKDGFRMTKLGEGDVNPTAVRKLIGENIPLSLEWEEFWHEELRGIYRDADDLFASYLGWLK